jgi:hypothetical protein
MVLKHEEIIGTISGGSAFSVNSIRLNPGDPAVLPWGHQLALAYDFYIPYEAELIIHSSLPATESGTMFAYPDADVKDSAPTDIIRASGNAHFGSSATWNKLHIKIPGGFMHTRRNFKVRKSSYPTGSTDDDYDCCRIWYGSEGLTSTKQIGYISLKYHFLLINPTIAQSESGIIEMSVPNNLVYTGQNPISLDGAAVTAVSGKLPFEAKVGDAISEDYLTFDKNWSGQIDSHMTFPTDMTTDITMADQLVNALTTEIVDYAPAIVDGLGGVDSTASDGTNWNILRGIDSFSIMGAPKATRIRPRITAAAALNGKNIVSSTLKLVFNALKDEL